jgi:uncharacterized protein YjlB
LSKSPSSGPYPSIGGARRGSQVAARESQVSAYLLADDGTIPNNSELPLRVYRCAVSLSSEDPAAVFEDLFHAHGWTASWRNGIFAFHHFHSTAHEVLGIYAGTASVRLGGDSGITLSVEPGDVVVVPAGVGHKKLGASSGFGVVGAYPGGQHADLCRGGEHPHAHHVERVGQVPLPAMDPVYGAKGPLFDHWRG